MSFLQPFILAALPLLTLPILIHLIHQRRHRTVPWGAMMFLVRARHMHRGMARLRYILILLLRMLAVAALIFALSRPLVSGWWGGLGVTEPDATLVLLDRSASMEVQNLQTGESKRSTALQKLAEFLEQRAYGRQLVLIDSAGGEPLPVESPGALLDLPVTAATATSADVPGMFEQALAYLEAHDSGRADLWICSDLSENDWNPESGRWAAIREQSARLKGVRLFLLAYPDRATDNLSVRVANVRRRQRERGAELILDVSVAATGRAEPGTEVTRRVPLEFEVDGVRSTLELELDPQGARLQGHVLPVDGELRSGWGSASLPADSNPLDNRFYFVFSEPPVRRSVVVAEDTRAGEAFRLALAIPAEPGLRHEVEVLTAARAGEIDWEKTGLLIWQAALPDGLTAEQIGGFVDAGRQVLFFPPGAGDDGEWLTGRWGDWQTFGAQPAEVAWWRGDADLLAHVGSGDPLPLNELRIYRSCALECSGTTLARFEDQRPLLKRVPTDRGGVYFCTTLPTAEYSSLERDGVVFYALLQRALAEGTRALAAASQRDAGPEALADRSGWECVAPAEDAFAIAQRGLRAGVYREDGDWAAVNRRAAEDGFKVVHEATVDGLFEGLVYQRIDDVVGDTGPLAREIWRSFLLAMMLALVFEAALCLPGRTREPKRWGDLARVGGGIKQDWW